MSLTERLQSLEHAIAWKGEIPLQSRYTLGLAGERFFREIRDHARLLATHCPACDWTYLPPRAYCERCLAELTEWVEIPPSGVVYSYTVLYRDLDEQPLDPPVVVAFVRLEGCDGGLIHYLLVEPEQAYIGMPVEVMFREERKGSIQDIAGFRPA
jgi:uncharacterized OB-fold protein